MKSKKTIIFMLLLAISLIPYVTYFNYILEDKSWISYYVLGLGLVHLATLIILLVKRKDEQNSLLLLFSTLITLTSIIHACITGFLIFVLGPYLAGFTLYFLLSICFFIGLTSSSIAVFKQENELSKQSNNATLDQLDQEF